MEADFTARHGSKEKTEMKFNKESCINPREKKYFMHLGNFNFDKYHRQTRNNLAEYCNNSRVHSSSFYMTIAKR